MLKKNSKGRAGLQPGADYGAYDPEIFDAIPLHKPDAKRTIERKGRSIEIALGKRPLHPAWTAKHYSSRKVMEGCRTQGRNMGIRLRPDQMVIDIDPRNGGNEGFAALCATLGDSFDPANYPTVRTGGGGLHIYMTKPAGVMLVDTVEGFPGVEFKSAGRQVLAAGSIHPETGNPYAFEPGHPSINEFPAAPKALLRIARRPKKATLDEGAAQGGHIPNHRLAKALEGLDPKKFRDHDKWLQVMMAAHHATGGEGRAEFIEWSTSDPEFADRGEEIGRRWDSLHAERDDGVTVASINRHLVKAKRNDLLLPTRAASKDFDDDIARAFKPESETSEFEPVSDAMNSEFERKATFKKGKNGKIIAASQDNIRTALDKLGATVSYDLFSDRIGIEGLEGFGPYLDDAALDRLWLRIDSEFRFRPSRAFFDTVIMDYARMNGFHPVRNYFDHVEFKWDGVLRLDRFLIDYAGAADSPYTRAVSALPIIGAVRRVRHPGSKHDEMVVLESPQGYQKSTALEILAIKKEWFTDSLPLNASSKEVIENISGKLIVECADLHGLKKADVDQVKAQLSRQVDRARMAYGRLQIERPRQCVIYGTANSTDYLRDRTGNRRFWPVRVQRFDLEKLRRDLDQLWGEAAFRERMGDATRLDPSLYGAAAAEQEKRTDIVADPFTDTLKSTLGGIDGKITSEDVWRVLGLNVPGNRTQHHNDRMGAAMKHLKWERRAIWTPEGKKPGYVRGKRPYPQIYVSGEFGSVGVAHTPFPDD